jgi:hypothetical protein
MKKPFWLAAVCLLFAAALGAQPSVNVMEVLPSSQNAQITVLANGEPLQNVKIEVFAADGKLRISIFTDDRGIVVLPPLPRGRYHIAATGPGRLGGDLLLNLSQQRKKNPSVFSLMLFDRPITLEERIAVAEASASIERIQELKGITVDPAGAAIPRIEIEVFERGAVGKAPMAIAESDATGHFSVRIAKGTYSAVLRAQGFSAQIRVFEIAPEADSRDLRIRMELAPST